ncbi:glycoside hydrolase family 66 protein [Gorillibacterium timonense]|uniref:glycoside hydrolase family 66 protein n=1 Tax=Gorillibacterium timonense TaxID=1689269 RepID=UPI00071C6EDD|nr:glycoside hydrolase family 66 protein [Gorillibacterium timonense]
MTQYTVNLDIYPDKAQYKPNGPGHLIVELTASAAAPLTVRTEIQQLDETLELIRSEISCEADVPTTLRIPLITRGSEWECYGVTVEVYREGSLVARAATAYDVADHWRRAPRYGFLSDFRSGEEGDLRDADSLNRFHLNVVQFYDWMYRHDSLIPPADEFIDPMGRTLSYKVVREKVDALHERGIAAMAYGAVYAALKDYLLEHPELGLYKRNGEPFHLIDIFYIMDISPDSPWTAHIVEEFRKVVASGFDGIHMDQYGFPKKAVRKGNGEEEIVDLAACYPALIDRTKQAVREVNPDAGLIFNNVSNYPVRATAGSDQEAVYIEVWPPVIHLRELKGLIDEAKAYGRGKQVILSAYLPAFYPKANNDAVESENGAVLTMATIFASGGYHLLLGEDEKLLTMAYYPDYAEMRPEFVRETRRYYDFIVRYGKLLYDAGLEDLSYTYTGGVNTEIRFEGDAEFAPNGDVGKVWTLVKRLPGYLVIHLINLVGLEDDHWEHGKANRPTAQREFTGTVLMEREIAGLYWASPDTEGGAPQELPFEKVPHDQGEAAQFTVPCLDIWTMLYVKWA